MEERCFASNEYYKIALDKYIEKQKRVDQEDRKNIETNEEDYNQMTEEINPNTIYNKYEIYSIATYGNAAYHFCAKFKSNNNKKPELLLSHQNSGATLLKIYKGPPTYSHNSVTLIRKGNMINQPDFHNIFMTALLWWYKNDVIERTTTYPGSCSGLVSCVISQFDPEFKLLVQNNDTYLEKLSKMTPQNPPKAVSANLNYKNLRSGNAISDKRISPGIKKKTRPLSFKNKSARKTKSVKKAKKSTRKSTKKVKKSRKSVRKSTKKVKKSTRKSKKVKKSNRKSKKVKKSSRKSVRKSVRKVKSRK